MHTNLINTNNEKIPVNRILSYILVSILVSVFIMYFYGFNYNVITLMLILLIPLMIPSFFLSNDLMHPFNIFFACSQFLFVFNILDYNANKGYFRYSILPADNYNLAFTFAVLVIIIWYLCMYFGYIIARNSSKKSLNKLKFSTFFDIKNPMLIALSLIVIGLASYFYVAYLKGGLSGIIQSLTNRTEAYAGLNYFMKLVGVTSIASLVLLNHGFKKTSFFLILLTFVMLISFGGRGGAFFGSLFPYILYYHYRIKNLKFIQLAPVGVIVIILALALGNYRLYEDARFNITGIYDMISKIASSTQGGETLPSLVGSLIMGEIDYKYGSTLINIIYAPIPRSIWPDKPIIDESGIVGQALMGNEAWGLPPGPYGIAFFNFGFIGVIVMGFCTGMLIYHMYSKFINNLSVVPARNTSLIFYVLSIMLFFNIFNTSAQIDILWNIGVLFFIKILDNLFSTIKGT